MPVFQVGALRLRSARPFPELERVRNTRDAWAICWSGIRARERRRIDWFHRWLLPGGRPWLAVGRLDDGYFVRFERTVDFLVEPRTRRIEVHPRRGIPPRTVRHLLLDQVVPMLIADAGRLVVHASAVDAGDGAIAFVGRAGVGKSTLAAALACGGAALVTDDCLVVDLARGAARVIPTYPGIRLRPDSLRALFPDALGSFGRAAHYSAKRRVTNEGATIRFCRRPAPLKALYLLSAARRQRGYHVSRVSGHRAFAALLRCTFHLDVGQTRAARLALDRVAALVTAVPVFALQIPRDLRRLPDVSALLARHRPAS